MSIIIFPTRGFAGVKVAKVFETSTGFQVERTFLGGAEAVVPSGTFAVASQVS